MAIWALISYVEVYDLALDLDKSQKCIYDHWSGREDLLHNWWLSVANYGVVIDNDLVRFLDCLQWNKKNGFGISNKIAKVDYLAILWKVHMWMQEKLDM